MSPAPGRVLHRCGWCGQASSSTTGPTARLVPIPVGMVEYLELLENRAGRRHRLRHDDYATSSPSSWWCRSVKACARRRGDTVELAP